MGEPGGLLTLELGADLDLKKAEVVPSTLVPIAAGGR